MECLIINTFNQCFYFRVYLKKKLLRCTFLKTNNTVLITGREVYTHTVHTTEKIYTGEDFETTDFPFKGNIDKISNDSLFIYCHVRFTTVHWKTLENMYVWMFIVQFFKASPCYGKCKRSQPFKILFIASHKISQW